MHYLSQYNDYFDIENHFNTTDVYWSSKYSFRDNILNSTNIHKI